MGVVYGRVSHINCLLLVSAKKNTNIPDVLRDMDPPDFIILVDVQFGTCPTKQTRTIGKAPTFDDEITIFNNIFHVDFTQCSYNVGALQLYMGL